MSFALRAKMHVPDEAVRHFVDRGYRDGKPFQWVREAYKNSEEAGATLVELGIERQAARAKGILRRTIIDNGHGMDDEHLVTFFKLLGVGGKSVGGPHENFAIGAKVSLLPWNPRGIVVISRRDGVDSMIWIFRDDSGDYALREWEVEDEDGSMTLTQVIEPYVDDEYGCDWSKVLPEWVVDHGTALVLLGGGVDADTVDGDPSRLEESDSRGIHKYLGSRLARLPDGMQVTVICKEDLSNRSQDRRASKDLVLATRTDGTYGGHPRKVYGLEALMARGAPKNGSHPGGEVVVDDYGTKIRWTLRDASAPAISDFLPYGKAFIASEYDNELYHHTSHTSTFRMFGIAHESVAKRLWLMIFPAPYNPKTGAGVYPNQSRSTLSWRGNDLPMSEWALTFAQSLPKPIQDALAEAYASGSGGSTIEDDKERRERLGARFGKRWRALRYVLSPTGSTSVNPVEGQMPRLHKPRKHRKRRNGSGGSGGSGDKGQSRIGVPDSGGSATAEERRVGVDLPVVNWVSATSLGEEAWAAARFLPSLGESGTVQLNQDHPLFQAEIREWQSTRANHLAVEVAKTVQEVYADLAVAHVAHIRNFAGTRVADVIISRDLVDQMLGPNALTCALAGLLGAEAMIQTRLGGRFGRAA
jgi:hypothetical protein